MNNYNFIVVDDDPINNFMCQVIIQKFTDFSKIFTFENPFLAIEFISEKYSSERENFHSIIFVDINMPGLNGWEFIDLLRYKKGVNEYNCKVYILTSQDSPETRKRAEEDILVSGFITKPLVSDSIMEIFKTMRGLG